QPGPPPPVRPLGSKRRAIAIRIGKAKAKIRKVESPMAVQQHGLEVLERRRVQATWPTRQPPPSILEGPPPPFRWPPMRYPREGLVHRTPHSSPQLAAVRSSKT